VKEKNKKRKNIHPSTSTTMNGPGYLAVAIQPGPNTDDKAFHEWYNTEHGPLRMRLPFITTGDRYKATDGQKPEWSAVYDVSDLSMLEKRIYTRLREERSAREKKVMGSFESLDRKIYSLFSERSKTPGYAGPGAVTAAVSMTIKEGDLEAFDKWYEEEHVGMLAQIPGWLRTRRFRMLVGGIKGMPPQGQVECLAVHDFEAQNGLNGPEHQAATNTPWRLETMDKLVVARERREWAHHLTFSALKEPPSSVLTTDGAELRFQLEGNPADPVVVMVNSILTNFSIWDDVAASLRSGSGSLNGKTYRTLRYNSRGYAQQDRNSNPTRFDLLADDLEYLLDRVGVDRAHAVLGVSMGGVTAINFAIRHPSKLSKFIACDCNVAAGAANNKAWADRVELAKKEGMGALAKVTVERWFTPANHGSAEFEKTLAMCKAASLEGFEQNAGALSNYDLKEKLAGIQTPGLLVAGEADGKLPEVMQTFGIPGAEFRAVSGAGHLPMLENLEGFMKVVGEFL
jgi:pimeloyl-ACP methyl ester carboxylesterase